MIVSAPFIILADALVNATQNPGTDPEEIRNAVEGIEDFCLGLEERIDQQKALIVASKGLIVALERQLARLERRIDRQVSR